MGTRMPSLPVHGDTVECDHITCKETKKKEFSHLESSSSQIIYLDLLSILLRKFQEEDSEEDLLWHATIAGIGRANMCWWEE
ncbi:MAG: hypothetical protein HXS54_10080 [Theionarchaea archaeon]|nr:hypothetical protein [Theionarchaea archaeon]